MSKYIISVRFLQTFGHDTKTSLKIYDYFWHEELEVGQKAIVNTAGPQRWDNEDERGTSYCIVEVVKCSDQFSSDKALKWLVDTFDTEQYWKRIENEKRKIAIKKELDRRLIEIQEAKQYDLLASDEEGKKLLEEFKSLE